MFNFILRIIGPDQQIQNLPLPRLMALRAESGHRYMLIDKDTRQLVTDLELSRQGSSLLVEQGDRKLLYLNKYYDGQVDEVEFVTDPSMLGSGNAPDTVILATETVVEPDIPQDNSPAAAIEAPAPRKSAVTRQNQEEASSDDGAFDFKGMSFDQDTTSMMLIGGAGLLGVAAVAASGGGDDDDASTGPAPDTAVATVNGSVVAGPVLADNDLKLEVTTPDGTVLGSRNVAEGGGFSLQLNQSYTGVIVVRVSNQGNRRDYLDETTGSEHNLSAELVALAVVESADDTLNLNVTPLSTLAYHEVMALNKLDDTQTVNQHNQAIADFYHLPRLHDIAIQPVVKDSGFNGEDLDDGEKYGAVLAILSGLDEVQREQDNENPTQAAIEELNTLIALNERGEVDPKDQLQELMQQGAAEFLENLDISGSKPFTLIYSSSQLERSSDLANGATVHTVKAVGQDLTYQLISGTDQFSVDENSGEVTLLSPLQPGSQPQFTVQVTDAKGNRDEQTVTLSVSNSDTDAPVFTSAITASVFDDAGAEQTIYTAQADDESQVTYTLESGGDSSLFQIDADTGQVVLAENPDIEQKSSYQFTVKATDSAGNHSSQQVTLTVQPQDTTAPEFTSGSSASDVENGSAAGQIIYTARATDDNPVTYSLLDYADYQHFSVDADSGAVTLTASPDLNNPDLDSENRYEFAVVATDAAGNSSEQAVFLRVVEAVSDDTTPPQFVSGSQISIDENIGDNQQVYTAQTQDASQVTYTLDTTLDDDHTHFTISGSEGQVILRNNPDYETKDSYSFTVIATDAAGNVSKQAVTLQIQDVAEDADTQAPEFTSGTSAAAVDDGSGAGKVVYTAEATDPEGNGGPSEPLTYALVPGDHSDAFDIDSSTGAVTLKQNVDASELDSYQFTVRVTDAAGNHSDLTVTLAVNPVEAEPAVINGLTLSSSEDQYAVLNEGDQIQVTVAVSKDVTVTGQPQLTLNIGGTEVQADYQSGSGSQALVFAYTLTSGLNDSDGIHVDADSLSLNEGTIVDAAGNDLLLTHEAVTDNSEFAVDTTRPEAGLTVSPGRVLQADAQATQADTMPQLTAVGDGDWVVVWNTQTGDDSAAIVAQRVNFSSGAQESPLILDNAAALTSEPRILVVNQQQDYVVAWSAADDDTDLSIHLQMFRADGTPVTGQQVLEADGVQQGADFSPVLAASGNGEFILSWTGVDDAGDDSIFVQAFDQNGNLTGDQVQLEALNETGAADYSPQVIATQNQYVISWAGQDAEGDDSIFIQRFSADQGRIGETLQLEALNVSDGSDVQPALAPVAGSDAFSLVWSGQNADGDRRIFYQMFADDGQPQGETMMLETAVENAGDDGLPQVLAGQVVVWQGQNSDGQSQIYQQLLNSDGSLNGEPTAVQPETGEWVHHHTFNLQPISDTQNYVISWFAADADGQQALYQQQFSADGSVLSSENITFDRVADSRMKPAIAVDSSDGSYQVAWSAADSADSEPNIIVQPFTAEGEVVSSLPVEAGDSVTVSSSENGTAYLVVQTETVASAAQIEALDNTLWQSAAVTADSHASIETTGLEQGSYQVYVSDAAGNLSDAAVTTVMISSDSQAPQVTLVNPIDTVQLEAPDNSQGLDTLPVMASLGDGAFVVVWQGQDGSDAADNNIMVQRFNADGTIGGNSLIDLDPINSGEDLGPQVAAVGSEGAYAVTWHGTDSEGDGSIYLQRFQPSGLPDGQVIKLEGDGVTGNNDLDPQITAVGSSEFVVTWYDESSEFSYTTYVQKFSADGQAIGDQVTLGAFDQPSHTDWFPMVTAIGTEGQYAVTWSGREGGEGDYSIFVQRFNADGSVAGDPVTLEAPGVEDQGDLTSHIAAVGDDGSFAVAWSGFDQDGDLSLFVQKFNTDGTMSGNEVVQLEAVNQSAGHDNFPQITGVGQQGQFVVTWFGTDEDSSLTDGNETSVYVQQFNADGTTDGFAPVKLEGINTPDGSDLDPRVTALGDDGSYAVVWSGLDSEGDNSIFVQRFQPDGTLNGNSLQLEATGYREGNDTAPQILNLNQHGDFVVSWSGDEGNNQDSSVYVQRLNADGLMTDNALIDRYQPVNVQSSETGTVYLVPASSDINTLAELQEAAVSSAEMTTAGDTVELATTDLADGVYAVYAADSHGNFALADNQVTIAQDQQPPQIEQIEVAYSAGVQEGWLNAGDSVNISVAWTEPVFVEGTPQLTLTLGEGTATADYLFGSGSRYLTFEYTVQSQDHAPDGIQIEADSLQLGDSVTITDGVGLAVDPTHAAVDANADYRIDNQPPTASITEETIASTESAQLQSNETGALFLVNSSLTVNSLEDIVSAADEWWNGELVSEANTDISVAAEGLYDGTYHAYSADEAGNLSSASTGTVTVESKAPEIVSISLNSDDVTNGFLTQNAVVNAVVMLDEAVTVGGTPQLALQIGGNTVQADYQSGSGSHELTFSYTINQDQADSDGISIDADSLTLNGGALTETYQDGKEAVLTHDALAAQSGFKVDAAAPQFISTKTAAVDENIGASQLVYTAAANDANDLTFSIQEASTDADAFSIDADSGALTLLPNPDFETKAEYAVTLTATDEAGNQSEQALTLTINDVDPEADTSVVIFDLVEGASSSHSNRTFNADVSYDIYVRVNSESSVLNMDGNWGAWRAADNLNSDDKVILVGNGSEIQGPGGNAVSAVAISNNAQLWQTSSDEFALALNGQGTFFRGTVTAKLWSGSWQAVNSNQNTLNNIYQTAVSQSLLTSQGLA